jgi:hypothetical protein
VICGNDPSAPLTPGDKAVIAWFEQWLAWAWRRDNGEDAGPEPECPNGRAINVAARAQETACELREAGEGQ